MTTTKISKWFRKDRYKRLFVMMPPIFKVWVKMFSQRLQPSRLFLTKTSFNHRIIWCQCLLGSPMTSQPIDAFWTPDLWWGPKWLVNYNKKDPWDLEIWILIQGCNHPKDPPPTKWPLNMAMKNLHLSKIPIRTSKRVCRRSKSNQLISKVLTKL